MRLARRVLLAALTVAVATYALDCVGMTTPEQAMPCCNSMRCPSHHQHGQQVDNAKMPERISAARAAILERAEEIQANPSGAEYRALDHALRTLVAMLFWLVALARYFVSRS